MQFDTLVQDKILQKFGLLTSGDFLISYFLGWRSRFISTFGPTQQFFELVTNTFL